MSGSDPPGVDDYQSVLSELTEPAGWEFVTERVQAHGTTKPSTTLLSGCPSVTRHSFVPGIPTDVYPEAKQLAAAAGFTLDREFGPDCAAPPASPSCAMFSTSGGDGLAINI